MPQKYPVRFMRIISLWLRPLRFLAMALVLLTLLPWACTRKAVSFNSNPEQALAVLAADTLTRTGDSLNGKTIEQLANTFTARTLIHAKRRSAEMDDAVATLEAAGVDPIMTRATHAQLENLAATDWASRLGPNGSDMDFRTAIAHLTAHA